MGNGVDSSYSSKYISRGLAKKHRWENQTSHKCFESNYYHLGEIIEIYKNGDVHEKE